MENPVPSRPTPEGVTAMAGDRVETAGHPTTRRNSSPADLAAIARDYELFTLGVLELASNVTGGSMLGRYAQERNVELRLLTLVFEKPLFAGFEKLGDPIWNYRITGLEKPDGRDFLDWLGRVAFMDSACQQLYRVCLQEISIADPAKLFTPTVITAAGLDTTIGCVAFIAGDPAALPLVTANEVVRDETRAMRDSVFAGRNPYEEVNGNA